MIGVLLTKVNLLKDQINTLYNEVSLLKGSVNSINSNIQNEIDDLIDELEEQGKNYFNVSTTIVDYNEDQMLTVELKFSLKEYQKIVDQLGFTYYF